MALAVGSLGYVDYREVPRVIHARLILDHVIGHTYVILTPDHHIYEESLNADENEDIDRFWPGQPNGSPPRSVPANCVYGFAPMSANQVARFMNLGAAVGRRLRGELGIDVEVARQGAAQTATGVADAVDAGPVVAHQPALRDGEYYVLAEMVLGKKIGERLEVPVDAPRLGAEHYLGETYKQGGGIVVPALTDHVSRKMQAQAQILKEKRKLAEASGKGGKGKNDKPPKPPPTGKAPGGGSS